LALWFIDDDNAAQAVHDAEKIGYRHFDTAQTYGNERGIGEGIRTWEILREQLFVTTKVAAEHKTYPVHMKSNVQVNFEISDEDMKILKNFEHIKDYGASGIFPVYGGKM
jgi:aryl-alcohol dehydrogenase-like predicted oxidoreductase